MGLKDKLQGIVQQSKAEVQERMHGGSATGTTTATATATGSSSGNIRADIGMNTDVDMDMDVSTQVVSKLPGTMFRKYRILVDLNMTMDSQGGGKEKDKDKETEMERNYRCYVKVIGDHQILTGLLTGNLDDDVDGNVDSDLDGDENLRSGVEQLVVTPTTTTYIKTSSTSSMKSSSTTGLVSKAKQYVTQVSKSARLPVTKSFHFELVEFVGFPIPSLGFMMKQREVGWTKAMFKGDETLHKVDLAPIREMMRMGQGQDLPAKMQETFVLGGSQPYTCTTMITFVPWTIHDAYGSVSNKGGEAGAGAGAGASAEPRVSGLPASIPTQQLESLHLPQPDTNVSDHFKDVYNRVKVQGLDSCGKATVNLEEFQARFPQAKDYRYILVPGLFTRHYPGYFDANEKWMQNLELEVHRVPLNTEESVAKNAEHIKTFIEGIQEEMSSTSSKKYVLIAHSKGCVDVLEALIKYPELEPHIGGLIFFQGPLNGTYVSTFVTGTKAISSIAKGITEQFGGTPESYVDLNYERCTLRLMQTANADNKYPWLRMTVTLGSMSAFDAEQMACIDGAVGVSSMKMTSDVMIKKTGFCSDGLVCPHDARLPFADFALVGDMFHSHPGLNFPNSRYHPGALTQTMLELLGEKLKREGWTS